MKKSEEKIAVFSLTNDVKLYGDSTKNGSVPSEKSYTFDDAVNKIGCGSFQYRLISLAGFVWIADAIEVIILSVIGQYLACNWTIYRWQNALLTSGVFAGMSVGCTVFGTVADKYGRKKSAMASIILLFVFGSVSAASPSYYYMLAFRAITGFALGGIAQVLTLCCEFFPVNMRGKAGFYLSYFWAAGTLLLVLISWATMTATNNNWRLLLFIAALPSLIVLLLFKWYPESARYHIITGNLSSAEKVLNQMAQTNKAELPPGRLLALHDYGDRGCFKDLFLTKYRRTTLLYWYMTYAAAFCYYGIAFISPTIIEKGSIYSLDTDNSSNSSSEPNESFTDIIPCTKLTRNNYIDLAWTSAAEFPGLVLMAILIERFDRKKLLFCGCICSSCLTFLLMLRITKTPILVFLFAARGILVACFQLLYVMVSESFPTTIRALALGTASGCARIGGLVIPYVSQVMIISNPVSAICVLGTVILIAGIAALFLPLETRGIELADSHITIQTTTSESSLQ